MSCLSRPSIPPNWLIRDHICTECWSKGTMTTATAKENDQILADAVARNAGVVLSLPSAGMLHNHKTRFLGGDADGLWVEVPPSAQLLLEELRAGNKPLAVSFHASHRRLSFLTTVVKI